MHPSIRLATPDDLPAINAIYNHYVLTSTCTYQETPSTDSERATWFAAHEEKHPVTVAVDDAGAILGWGSLNPFHPRSAYRFTVENSLYVRHDLHRRGIGTLLLHDLIQRAETLGHHSILALISADQPASITLHQNAGFSKAGHLHEVGFKFKKWLDVIYLQRFLRQPKK